MSSVALCALTVDLISRLHGIGPLPAFRHSALALDFVAPYFDLAGLSLRV